MRTRFQQQRLVAGGLKGQGTWAPTGSGERRGARSETGAGGTALGWGRRLTLKQVVRERETQDSGKLLPSPRTDTQVRDGGKGQSAEEASCTGGKGKAARGETQALAHREEGLEKEER